MSAWWLLLAFALGFAVCWWSISFISEVVLKRPKGQIFENVIQTMRQDSLLRLEAAVQAEKEKRRST